jgi:hypothetical protein
MNSSFAQAVERHDSSPASSNELGRGDSFEFVRASECSADRTQEIVSFLDSQNSSHPFQLPTWGGDESFFAILRRESKICWFAQCGCLYPAGRLLYPIRALIINRGPVCDDFEILGRGLDELVKAADANGFARIDIIPEWASEFGRAAEAMLSRSGWRAFDAERTSLRLDLAPEPDNLLASFRKTSRYEIRRSEAHKLRVRMAERQREQDEWLKLYLEMTRRKHFAPENPDHIRRILGWLGPQPNRGALLLAHDDSKLLGGIVIVRTGTRCWYLLGATSKNERLGVGHLLQWRAIQWAKEKGCREYDFSGYREGEQSGPALFKRGFCDNVVRFCPAMRYVVKLRRHRTSEMVGRVRRTLRS